MLLLYYFVLENYELQQFHRLKPQSLKEVVIYAPDFLGNRVAVDSYWVSADEPTGPRGNQVGQSFADSAEQTLTNRKRQTGGVISGKNFPPR